MEGKSYFLPAGESIIWASAKETGKFEDIQGNLARTANMRKLKWTILNFETLLKNVTKYFPWLGLFKNLY